MPVYNPGPDLMDELMTAKAEMENRVARAASVNPGWDDREMAEREEAAQAYAGEDEKHFVDYAQDCIRQSNDANKEIRQIQADCWNCFKEKPPVSYGKKESWQSRIVVSKPYPAVMYGASSIKKAFSPDFLSIRDERNEAVADFWKTILQYQTNELHANLPQKFTDASIMGMAVGQGMEVIPTYVAGRGLRYDLVEPWKICRDPDAPPRDPQGGLYWIHQEWLDYYALKQGEADGKYTQVDKAKAVAGANSDDPFMTEEAIRHRKDQIWSRSKFRTMILVSEFWGGVLSPKGEMLLPKATYTIAGGRVIELPKLAPYKRLRWPGVSWSPMPDLLAHGGRGLIEGVITIWESMCNLMCLHEDALKWVVNPPSEVNVNGLIDPTDVDDWPGKKYLVKNTPNGQQVIRTIDRRDTTNSILANMQYHDMNFQRGSMITDAVQGLPGYRKDITARESAQNLEQSMGVFGLMGSNMESGCIELLTASQDVIEAFGAVEDFQDILNPETLVYITQQGGQFPRLSGSYSVSGVASLMKDQEMLKVLTTIIAPMAESPIYQSYIDPYAILKAIERRTSLRDEGVIVDPQTAAIKKQLLVQAAVADMGGGGEAPPNDE
jgi:hypothetical protein